MRSRASWRLIHGQRPRECEVSRYRHGCDPPKPAGPIFDCDPVPSSQCCWSHPQFSPPEATRLLPMFLLMLAVGCRTPPTYEGAFSAQHEIKGNSNSNGANVSRSLPLFRTGCPLNQSLNLLEQQGRSDYFVWRSFPSNCPIVFRLYQFRSRSPTIIHGSFSFRAHYL